jgi:hypothetical protein
MLPRARIINGVGLALVALASLSCGGEGTPVEEPGPWTVGTVEVPLADGAWPPSLPVLTALEPRSFDGYDRVTLSFEGAEVLPGYRATYVDRPLHECGSGRQVFPVGDAWLEIRLEPAAAHTEAGEATLPAREIAVAGEGPLRRVYRTCDFEGVVVLVLALDAPNPFRVTAVEEPLGLAVDVLHEGG